jgi:periplasmic divalent cation tolerance protein
MHQNSPANADDLLVVVTSLPHLEAATALARALVEAQLAACVQISEGLYSVYRWEGKICEEQEVLLSAKTIAHRWDEICVFIKESHPYELPEILAFSPKQYEQQYGEWVQAEVNSKP